MKAALARYVFIALSVLIAAVDSHAQAQDLQSKDHKRSLAEITERNERACQTDSECVAAPEVNSACFHYCNGAECQSFSKVCPVVNPLHSGLRHASCVLNAPCIRPQAIRCVNRFCSAG